MNDSQQYLERPDQIILSGHGNIGFGRAVNLGLHAVDGDYALIVNPDCITTAAAATNFIGALMNSPGITVPLLVDDAGIADYRIYESWVFTPTRRLSAIVARHFIGRGSNSVLPRFMKAPGTFIGMSRGTAARLGPFDDDYFLYGEDRDLSLRARKARISLNLDRTTTIIHEGGQSGRTVSTLVARSKVDAALRVAFTHRGRTGLVLLGLNLLIEALARELLGRKGALKDLLWSARRWRSTRPARPLTEADFQMQSRSQSRDT
ncbi:glycosyltransferase family 2 protein [Curtobacterium sp. MCPF17_050]|uniref:glycosyltransferase family 2 protein n=1 Tax=Curtobacterium sp. MCPF17_050 TaxID=2175664 RepID=UPI0011B77EE2|nr:glycosyltransferase family 2 protein [Curtobacterium sp. MCPF17_050]WIB16063.1 glycosyltransferase family 2 protein [Curtobacterium sp. MCPF17_050]